MDLKANAADSIGPLTVNLQEKKKRVLLFYLIVRGGIELHIQREGEILEFDSKPKWFKVHRANLECLLQR